MQEIYRKTFEQIKLKEESKQKLRSNIEQTSPSKGAFPRSAIKWAASAAILALIIVSVFQTSSYVAAATEYMRQLFHFGDGSVVEIIHEENATVASHQILQDTNSYICLENEKLYFIFDNNYEDITDKVSENTYFRYEKSLDNGEKTVILVGGTPDSYGWVELLFDENGSYIANRMNVPVPVGAWVDKAMAGENVPTGNPYYDFGIGDAPTS